MSSFPWKCPLLQPKNFHLGRFLKFVEMSRFLTICFFLKLLQILMYENEKKYKCIFLLLLQLELLEKNMLKECLSLNFVP